MRVCFPRSALIGRGTNLPYHWKRDKLALSLLQILVIGIYNCFLDLKLLTQQNSCSCNLQFHIESRACFGCFTKMPQKHAIGVSTDQIISLSFQISQRSQTKRVTLESLKSALLHIMLLSQGSIGFVFPSFQPHHEWTTKPQNSHP